MNEAELKVLFVLVAIALVILLATIVINLPPHTDPRVEYLGLGRARVHDGEQLALWVQSGKTLLKYSFLYQDNKLVGDGFLYHEEVVFTEDCVKLRVQLFYQIEACKEEGGDIIVEWPVPGVRWAD